MPRLVVLSSVFLAAGCLLNVAGLAGAPADGDVDAGSEPDSDADSDADAEPDSDTEADADADSDTDDDDDGCIPSAEVCNGLDDDCDGEIDEDPTDGVTYHEDSDQDGYGNATSAVRACAPPEGWVEDGTDCDDDDEMVRPGAEERCNGTDDDCDGAIDEDACSECDRHERFGKPYLFCASTSSWEGGRTFCTERGYDLVIVNDADEQSWLWGVASAIWNTDWWIGLTDVAEESTYVWVDGTTIWEDGAALGYTNWRYGAPENNDSQDCIELDGGSGLWADGGCGSSQPFICELGDG